MLFACRIEDCVEECDELESKIPYSVCGVIDWRGNVGWHIAWRLRLDFLGKLTSSDIVSKPLVPFRISKSSRLIQILSSLLSESLSSLSWVLRGLTRRVCVWGITSGITLHHHLIRSASTSSPYGLDRVRGTREYREFVWLHSHPTLLSFFVFSLLSLFQ